MESTATTAQKKVEEIKAVEPATLNEIAGSYKTESTSNATGSEAEAKALIYQKESGNNPKARNADGCLGLGQACPGKKLLDKCPNLDYECEDAFFTDYMINRYGTWAKAKTHWLARVPINGKDVGNWW